MVSIYASAPSPSHLVRRTVLVIGELLLLTLLAAAAQALGVWTDEVDIRVGDGPWVRGTLSDIPEVNDVVWLRARLDLREMKRTPGHPLAIYWGAMASHELWWDGVLLGKGGVVGHSKESEVPGPIEAHYQIPDALATPAVHTVLLRTSAFHRGFHPRNGYWTMGVADYDALLKALTHSANRAMIALSGIVLTGVFAFALFWVARRDRSFLLLGTLCLTAAALLIAEAWRPLFGYTYDWHIVRLRVVVLASWLVGVQLVALVVTRFPHRHGRWLLLGTVIAASIAPFTMRAWDPKSVLIFIICFTAALWWTIFAAIRRLHGSTLALIGVTGAALALALNPWAWVDDVLYLALNFLFLSLLCSHALEVRREQDERARLELEMVRRQLQPHFLMNTLTALSEWIEQEPKTAVRMIEALAEELRTLRELSSRTLVPVGDELRLCRSHIANMALRHDAVYELDVEDVDEARQVPPAVFHTLIENAMTHGTAGVMKLTERLEGNRVRYIFETPAGDEAARPEGGGTRYIQARLREAWGSAWSFTHGRNGNLWRTEIEVPLSHSLEGSA
jgi:hypothetical protein